MRHQLTIFSAFVFISLTAFAQRKNRLSSNFQDIKAQSRLQLNNTGSFKLDSFVTNDYKEILFFNNNGNLIEDYEYIFNIDSGQWLNDYKTLSFYDSNNNNIEDQLYRWSNDSSKYYLNNKNEYTYDSIGNLVSTRYFGLYNNKLEGNSKNIYKYDNEGNRAQDISYYLNSTNNTWNEEEKTEYFYDLNRYLISEIVSGGFYVTQKTSYTNDSLGNKILELHYSWNGIKKIWEKNQNEYDEKNEYQYDVNGNKTQWIRYNKKSTDSVWVKVSKYEFDYNLNISTHDILGWQFDAGGSIFDRSYNAPTQYRIYDWDENSSSWEAPNVGNLYYSSTLLNVEQNESNFSVSLSPNPVKDELLVQLEKANTATFQLFDILGNQILSIPITINHKINLSNLSPGIYAYKILSNEKINSGKLIKE